ncbi:energy transducer TonB [Winogradskyella schleiferi]|uniref:energy transducer TonB n=1 Tax=Winogradskyella schleiferi TaxID=2686078 RepID=UPI0015BAC566|nr:energy transducer TonB [Winogradskyella schleiferi]
MKSYFSISIPNPCHEDWIKMTPNEKGRFCQSCSKSVIDFTQMPQQTIEAYLVANNRKKICGRFKVSQLEQIRIEIPQHIIQQETSFHKLFLLVLLIVMGTSLLNCSDQNGNTKKIDAVEVTSTHKVKSNQLPKITASKIMIDSTKTMTIPNPQKSIKIHEIPVSHITGDIIEVNASNIKPLDSTLVDEHRNKPTEEIVFGHVIQEVAEFINTPDSLSRSEKKEYLSSHISKIVTDNFNIEVAKKLGLKGKQRFFTQFKIDENGYVKDIKIRKSSNIELENEAIRVINLLPQFKPAKQGMKNVAAIYTLPITFLIED